MSPGEPQGSLGAGVAGTGHTRTRHAAPGGGENLQRDGGPREQECALWGAGGIGSQARLHPTDTMVWGETPFKQRSGNSKPQAANSGLKPSDRKPPLSWVEASPGPPLHHPPQAAGLGTAAARAAPWGKHPASARASACPRPEPRTRPSLGDHLGNQDDNGHSRWHQPQVPKPTGLGPPAV